MENSWQINVRFPRAFCIGGGRLNGDGLGQLKDESLSTSELRDISILPKSKKNCSFFPIFEKAGQGSFKQILVVIEWVKFNPFYYH